MIANEGFKDSRILIVHGKGQKLTDVHQPIKAQFAQVTTASHLSEVPNLKFDLIVVDYSVADMTGILIYKHLHTSPNFGLIPAIFIADTRSYDHRLNAFEIGAVDFISRPFTSRELVRKCKLHIQNQRRISEDQSIHIGNLSLYPATKEVGINGSPVALTQLEYNILYLLLSTPRQVVSRSEIYEKVWGPQFSSSGRLDTQLYNLKKKLANFNGKIKSVNKVGMRILIGESIFSQEPKKAAPRSRPPEQRP